MLLHLLLPNCAPSQNSDGAFFVRGYVWGPFLLGFSPSGGFCVRGDFAFIKGGICPGGFCPMSRRALVLGGLLLTFRDFCPGVLVL